MSLDQWINLSNPKKKKESIKPAKPKATEKTLQIEIDADKKFFLLKTPFDTMDNLTAVELKDQLDQLYKIAETKKTELNINWKNNSAQLFSREIVYSYAWKLLREKSIPSYELITQLRRALALYLSEEEIRRNIEKLINKGKLFKDDEDTISLHKPKTAAEEINEFVEDVGIERAKKAAYKLPTGAIAVYFKEGEGYTFHYDAREYDGREEALLTNLGVLLQIWNKLIEMNYSPRYLNKAFDDDIYAIVLTNVEKETDEKIEINGLRVHISKHPLDAKILDLSQWTPKIPDKIEKKMFDKNIYFENPMLKYQETLSKLKSQEEKAEKPQETTSEGECAKYTVEYIKQLVEKDPFIYDPRFQKIWYTDEITYAYTHNDWHTNSGHFNAIMKEFTKCWKKNGGDIWDFDQQIGHIIYQNKDKHLKQLMKHWKNDLERDLKIMEDYAKERNIEETETWRKHSLQTWRELNMIREELKLKLLPIPKMLNSTQEAINRVSSERNDDEPEKPVEQKTTTVECAKYSLDYIKQLIEDDPFIFDPRYQKIWYRSEFEHAYASNTWNDWRTNSGDFNYVVQCWKKNGGDKEELFNIIHQNRDRHLHTLMGYWEEGLKKHIDNMKDHAKERNFKLTEKWRKYAINTWRELNLIREELKLTLLPIPEILNLSTREVILKVLSESDENILDKYTEPTKDDEKSEPTGEESLEEKKNKIREIFKKKNLYRPELEENIEQIAKGELNLDTILSIEKRRITPITNEDIKHAIEEAVFHVGNYIPETTKKIYREKGSEEAIKFLKQHIKDWGSTGPGELTIDGDINGILVQTDVINPPYRRSVKYNEILNYILYHIKSSPETKKEQPKKEYVCELCGRKTNELHQLKNGPLHELLPDKKVCWQCYVKEHRKLYEKYGKCPECNARIHLKEWPDFECDNGHVINVNSIEIDTKKMLDDIYGKVSPEKYKELHDKLYTVKDAIEEKYNKPVHGVHLATVNKSLTGVAYISITTLPIKELKEKIREEEGLFAGLSVMFKDDFGNEIWMDENFTEIEKPEIIKKAEKNLKKITQGYRSNNSEEEYSTQHTSLDNWTKEGD